MILIVYFIQYAIITVFAEMNNFEIWPGPMEGVGRKEFVKAATTLDLTDKWMTPFIRITESMPSPKHLFDNIRAYLDTGLPVTVQLMGNDPVLLGKCANILLSSPEISDINLNLGCPSARVVKHHAGGGLLKFPEKAAALCTELAAIIPAGKLSVKLRAGYDSADDMEKLLPVLAAAGIAKIFFHFRTVAEAYSAEPLPERAGRISRAVQLCRGIPVIANGDISSPEEAEILVKETGAAGVMIARPWMRDPFLLRRFSGKGEPDPENGRERFFECLKNSGIHGGALIEMAKMLWGRDSLRFHEIIRQS